MRILPLFLSALWENTKGKDAKIGRNIAEYPLRAVLNTIREQKEMLPSINLLLNVKSASVTENARIVEMSV